MAVENVFLRRVQSGRCRPVATRPLTAAQRSSAPEPVLRNRRYRRRRSPPRREPVPPPVPPNEKARTRRRPPRRDPAPLAPLKHGARSGAVALGCGMTSARRAERVRGRRRAAGRRCGPSAPPENGAACHSAPERPRAVACARWHRRERCRSSQEPATSVPDSGREILDAGPPFAGGRARSARPCRSTTASRWIQPRRGRGE